MHPSAQKWNSAKSVGVSFLAIFLTSVARFWRSRGQERQQMKWITYATGATFAMVWLAISLDAGAPDSALTKVMSLLRDEMFAGIPVGPTLTTSRARAISASWCLRSAWR
jgi:hypothetical protein